MAFDKLANHTVNVVTLQSTTDTGNLDKVRILKTSYGETACGKIRLHYDMFTAELSYDTRISPDGLQTTVTDSVGDEVLAFIGEERERIQVSEHMVKIAQNALSERNVVQSNGYCFEELETCEIEQ